MQDVGVDINFSRVLTESAMDFGLRRNPCRSHSLLRVANLKIRRHLLHPILERCDDTLLYGFISCLFPLFRVERAIRGTMSSSSPPPAPSWSWRFSSSLLMGAVGTVSRGFLYGLNYMEVTGLEKFMETLDKRKDVEGRERGLITGTESNGNLAATRLIGVRSVESCQRVCQLFLRVWYGY